ncbi:SGNH/GDSL hydrolase family protein [Streptomyces albicerus]|uniref:SGNH/GDSL hydrolase family protein n=1 Tax=Streptomyces albicerus TaxID=2569859 RepID=UPI00124B5AB7|nr:SGNH/GDSL hydrolase family protein [Streptomyces albicerus]
MARHWFGQSPADWTFTVGAADAATLAGGVTVKFYDQPTAGTQYTDLLDSTGAPITQVVSATGATGLPKGTIPRFQGPDNITSMWADAGGGYRSLVMAVDLGADVTANTNAFNAHAGTANAHLTKLADLTDTSVAQPTVDVKGGGLLTYDAVQGKWRPDGSSKVLMGWHAALANRHYARANIVCIGDSITEGHGTDSFARTWPARLQQLLRSRFPTDGSPKGGRGFIGAISTGSTSFTWPATVTGGPANNDDWGPKRLIPMLDAAAPADRVAYAALQGTAVDIMWVRDVAGGNFQWRVDGGAWTTVATGGAQQDGMLTRVTLGASGAHSLDIEANSAGFQAFVSGVIEYDGDENAGITVHDCGHFGWDTSFWISVATTSTTWPSAISALNPHLIVIMLGANDQFLNNDPAVFQSNLVSLISSLRGAALAPNPFPPILLAMHAARGGSFTYPWSDYVGAAHNVAAADALVTVLDLTLGPRLPGQAESPNHGLYFDTAHLSNKGCSYVADRIADFIAPR